MVSLFSFQHPFTTSQVTNEVAIFELYAFDVVIGAQWRRYSQIVMISRRHRSSMGLLFWDSNYLTMS